MAADLPDNLGALRSKIEATIPVGFNAHETPAVPADPNLWVEIQEVLWSRFGALHAKVAERKERARKQLGTLGGGNHFIELCLDEEQRVWLMLHSGSRNIGKEIAEAHIKIARTLEHNQGLPDRDLAYFVSETPELAAYRNDLYWAQSYAALNREVMLGIYRRVISETFDGVRFDDAISCHHNYVAEEVHFGERLFVTRKGAIRAGAGDLGIIPGSMGAKSFVVEGLGNPEALESASHGAGRRMSRGQAKRTFTLADLKAQTAGVECRKDAGVIDEIPAAYKSIDEVMANQRDLVKVRHTLKQVLCVKG